MVQGGSYCHDMSRDMHKAIAAQLEMLGLARVRKERGVFAGCSALREQAVLRYGRSDVTAAGADVLLP